jgi:5-methylcytosine-specific restriction endonuclease McrA
MKGIENRAIVLKLNNLWQPVGMGLVWKSVVDLAAGLNCYALDIDYAMDADGEPDFDRPTKMIPCDWDTWCTLPVRPWDFVLHSPSTVIRVPTVLIAKNYSKMPVRRFRGNPNFHQIWLRDNGTDQYTGKKLQEGEGSVDHVLPRSRGGDNSWGNVVLTHKRINWKKGNKLNSEVGLKPIRPPAEPRPVPASAIIRDAKHVDWKHFLIERKN